MEKVDVGEFQEKSEILFCEKGGKIRPFGLFLSHGAYY